MVYRGAAARAAAIALGCVAMGCSNGSGHGGTVPPGATGLSIGDTRVPVDAGMPPVITQIPIPPDCQSPGFPGGDQHVDTASIEAQLTALKPAVEQRQQDLLNERYDLSDNPSATVFMTRGKPIQVGVRVKLPDGQTWDSLNLMGSDKILAGDLFPAGFYPLPHPNHQLGGMLFTHLLIDELNRQTGNFRNQTRFDLDFDLPDQLLPEFPPAMFLTNHTELGDVSQGQMVTIENFYDMFKNMLNPQELEGLRLLVTPFPQQ